MSTQNYTTPDDNQKYGQKCLGRRYWTVPLLPGPQHKKNNKKTWKITIKNNKKNVTSSLIKLAYIYIYMVG